MGYCCICGKEVGDDVLDGLLINDKTMPICEECGEKLDLLDNLDRGDSRREEVYAELQGKMKAGKASLHVMEAVEEIYEQEEPEPESAGPAGPDQYEDEDDPSKDLEEVFEDLSDKLMMTTANNLEGYHVTKQLGVVFGETVYKPSASQQFVSSVGDMFRAFSFSRREMTGQVTMIEEARQFAYIKMMKAALRRGANAIIAIDSDNTVGNEIFYTSLYGTAVYVEKDK